MGSTIALWLDTDETTARPVFDQAQALVAAAERVLSRFDPQSELSQFHARPQQWVAVSPLLWDTVTRALTMAQATDGLFDPTLLSALEAIGYTRSFAAMQGVAQDSDRKAAPGRWMAVRPDPARRALWLPEGSRLDLGGIAKGLTAQRVVGYLSRWGPCLVDAGGDLVAGGRTPWTARMAGRRSGADYRRWQQHGRGSSLLVFSLTAHRLLAASRRQA